MSQLSIGIKRERGIFIRYDDGNVNEEGSNGEHEEGLQISEEENKREQTIIGC